MAPNTEGHSHRAHGKQSNKSFKSKHSTKSSLRDQAKGRTHRPATKDPATRAVKAASSTVQAKNLKVNRKNHAKQVLAKKKELLEENRNIFNGKNKHGDKVQRVVAVIPMTDDVDAEEIVKQLAASIDSSCDGVEGYRSVKYVTSGYHDEQRLTSLPRFAAFRNSTISLSGSSCFPLLLPQTPSSRSSMVHLLQISSSLPCRVKKR